MIEIQRYFLQKFRKIWRRS